MDYLSEGKGNSPATRSLRKTGIVSFLCYAADIEPAYTNSYLEAKAIKNMKIPKPHRDFLTVEEYRVLLGSIDTQEPEGFKHYVLISVMYETAARVSEAAGMDLKDFSF